MCQLTKHAALNTVSALIYTEESPARAAQTSHSHEAQCIPANVIKSVHSAGSAVS